MRDNLKTNFCQLKPLFRQMVKVIFVLILTSTFTSCSTSLQSKVAGNLNQFSKQHTVAILPVEIIKKDQKETARMLRQGLYAHLKESNFNILERYVVDGLLKQHDLNNPADFLKINPMRFAEILGADAVLISRVNRMERSYLVVHSSIEIGVSAQLVDTRTGEILWRAEQTEQDYQGLAKIPTGISSAILGPIRFVTNKLNLRRITSKLVTKLTATVKNPKDADKKETFEEPLIASSTTRDLQKIKTANDLKAEWREDSDTFTKVPFLSKAQKNIREKPASARQQFIPETEEIDPNHINWIPRKTVLQKAVLGSETTKMNPTSIFTTTSATPTQVQSKQAQYTIQVGAFKTESNANQMVRGLLKKGYQAHVTPDTKNAETIFKIHIDEFGNKKQAKKVSKKFNSKENLSSFVTTIDLN